MSKKVNKKLETSKAKVSKQWSKYRTEKKRILGLKRLAPEFKRGLLQEQRNITRKNISLIWDDYRGFKYSAEHKSDIPEFAFTKKYQTVNSIQKIYKAKGDYDINKLDTLIPSILQKEKVNGVALIFKIKDTETGQMMYVSDYITKGLYDRLKEKDINLYDHLSDKLYFKGYQEYELKSINIKVIYSKN